MCRGCSKLKKGLEHAGTSCWPACLFSTGYFSCAGGVIWDQSQLWATDFRILGDRPQISLSAGRGAKKLLDASNNASMMIPFLKLYISDHLAKSGLLSLSFMGKKKNLSRRSKGNT